MIKLTGVKLDIPYPCDGCGAIKNVVTEIKCIRTNPEAQDSNARIKGISVRVFLCYRCRNTLHSNLGKHIALYAGPY